MGRKKPPPANDNRLRSLIERIERLEEERRLLKEDVNDIYDEAKSAGFEPKMIRLMIKERKLTDTQREEERALADVYRAALGMLDGTPLGEAARRRLMGQQPPAPPPDSGNSGGDASATPPADPAAPDPPTAQDALTARAEGAAAALAGKPVLANPYPAGSPLRGAWDEGWCSTAGSDGMDVPAAFRRTKSKSDKSAGSPPPPGE